MTATDEFQWTDAAPATDLPPADDFPEEDTFIPEIPNALVCEHPGCLTPLVYSGRGRKPKKCDQHKRKSTASGPRTATRQKRSTGVDYTPGVMGLFQIPAGVLGILGTANPTFLADSATITVYAPPVAVALSDLANERPEIAAVLDRVLAIGPYSALVAAVAPMILQILCNHGVVPVGILGTTKPDDLVAYVVAQQEAAMRAATGQ